MLGPIMLKMAALTPSGQVLGIAVGGVVVEVAGGKTHQGPPQPIGLVGPSHALATPVAPGVVLTIQPSAVGDAQDDLAVWPAAAFASALGATEADRG